MFLGLASINGCGLLKGVNIFSSSVFRCEYLFSAYQVVHDVIKAGSFSGDRNAVFDPSLDRGATCRPTNNLDAKYSREFVARLDLVDKFR